MTDTPRSMVLGLVCALAIQGLRSNVPTSGSGAISGRVVVGDGSTTPVRRARIALRSSSPDYAQTVTSTDEGKFVFQGLPAGRYSLQAFKPPFLPSFYGATRPGRAGTPIELRDGQTISENVIQMSLGAAIEGHIFDADGQPMPGALVTPLRFGRSATTGEATLVATERIAADDRGAYRAYSLLPGNYIVVGQAPTQGELGLRSLSSVDIDRIIQPPSTVDSVQRQQGTPVVWSPVYYPGTPDLAAAERIVVGSGDERLGADFAVRLYPASRVSGTVTVPDSLSPDSVQVTISPSDPQARASAALGFSASTRPLSDGRFAFDSVPPGSYLITSTTGLAGGGRSTAAGRQIPIFWASKSVSMSGQNLEVGLVLQSALRATGRVEPTASSSLLSEEASAFKVWLTPLDSAPHSTYQPSAQWPAPRSFSIDGIIPGRYRLNFSNSGRSQQWFVVSATVAERDVLESYFDIREPIDNLILRISDKPSEISGTLLDSSGRAAPEYFIVVFSTNEGYWSRSMRRVVEARPATDGTYSVKNLPAGEYYIAALTDLEPGEAREPAFLQTLVPDAVKITVLDGQKTLQSLKIGR